jgi:hypothetical protein
VSGVRKTSHCKTKNRNKNFCGSDKLKTCNHCRQEKDDTAFPRWKNNPDGTGLSNTCRVCTSNLHQKYYYKNLEKSRERARFYAKRRYWRNKKHQLPDRITYPNKPRKSPGVEKLIQPNGSIYKRCSNKVNGKSCFHPLFVFPYNTQIHCSKCGVDYKVIKAISESRRNKGGIILKVVS